MVGKQAMGLMKSFKQGKRVTIFLTCQFIYLLQRRLLSMACLLSRLAGNVYENKD